MARCDDLGQLVQQMRSCPSAADCLEKVVSGASPITSSEAPAGSGGGLGESHQGPLATVPSPPAPRLNSAQLQQELHGKVSFVQNNVDTALQVLRHCREFLVLPGGFIHTYNLMWREQHAQAVEKDSAPLRLMVAEPTSDSALAAAQHALIQLEALRNKGLLVLPDGDVFQSIRELWRKCAGTEGGGSGTESPEQECELLLLINMLLTGSNTSRMPTPRDPAIQRVGPERILLDWIMALNNREFPAGFQNALRAWMKIRGCPTDTLDSIHDISRLVSRRGKFAPNCEAERTIGRLLCICRCIVEGDKPPIDFPDHPNNQKALLLFAADNFRRELKRNQSAATAGGWGEMNLTNMAVRNIPYVRSEVYAGLRAAVSNGFKWHDAESIVNPEAIQWLQLKLESACGMGSSASGENMHVFGAFLADQINTLPAGVEQFIDEALGEKALQTALTGLTEVWAKQQDHGTAESGTERGQYANRY